MARIHLTVLLLFLTACSGQPDHLPNIMQLAANQRNPDEIAASDTTVFWVNHGVDHRDGQVMELPAVPTANASPVTVLIGSYPHILAASQQEPTQIALDGENVYWTTAAGAIMRAPQKGGSPQAFVAHQRPQDIATDATSLYWINSDESVFRMPLSGGTPSQLDPAHCDGCGAFVAVDSTSVYWTRWSAPQLFIVKSPLNGGTITTLTPTADFIAELLVYRDNVYWITLRLDTVNHRLNRIPTAGGEPTTVVDDSDVTGLVANNGFIYFGAPTRISRVAYDGTDRTVIATGPEIAPWRLAATETRIFWTNFDPTPEAGTVWSMDLE